MSTQKRVAVFEKRIGWDRTPKRAIIDFLKEDARELNERNARHKLLDVHFQTLQLANRLKVDMDRAMVGHMKAAEKKYRKRKPRLLR